MVLIIAWEESCGVSAQRRGFWELHTPPHIPNFPGLRVVETYKHLGSILEDSGSAAPDVAHRVSSAMAAYAPLARKVFCSRER